MSSSKTSSTPTEKPAETENEFEQLCSEAHANAKRDRVALRAHLKKLKRAVSGDQVDDSALLLYTEAITKTSEALSKSNLQIIQIAQLKLKNKKPTLTEDEMLEQDRAGLYDEISGETNDGPN